MPVLQLDDVLLHWVEENKVIVPDYETAVADFVDKMLIAVRECLHEAIDDIDL